MKSKKKMMLIDLHFKAVGLKNQGFSLNDCASIADALAELYHQIENKKELPDAILINAYRITISEIDWFKDILINGQFEIPIIILDSNPTASRIRVFRRLGVSDYLQENCSMDTLLMQINLATSLQSKRTRTTQRTIKKEFGISRTKRTIDIIGASLLLICLSPLFLIVMLALKLESNGPMFYWQHRVGTGYKIFKFFKFRSMQVNSDQMLAKMESHNHYQEENQIKKSEANKHSSSLLVGDNVLIDEETLTQQLIKEQSQSFKKFSNDPRVTKVGHWIRKTSIDELPQLINVLLGDMSLVGNRPLPLYEAETLTSDDWTERFMAPAGITGLWQVTERGKKTTSADSRKQLDIQYARKHNLFMDLKILFKTPFAVIQQEKV